MELVIFVQIFAWDYYLFCVRSVFREFFAAIWVCLFVRRSPWTDGCWMAFALLCAAVDIRVLHAEPPAISLVISARCPERPARDDGKAMTRAFHEKRESLRQSPPVCYAHRTRLPQHHCRAHKAPERKEKVRNGSRFAIARRTPIGACAGTGFSRQFYSRTIQFIRGRQGRPPKTSRFRTMLKFKVS